MFVDHELHGLAYQHPSVLQIIRQLHIINKYWNYQSTTGQLIQYLWENTIQKAGMRGDSKLWNWEKINKYIPPNWISRLMENAQSMDVTIALPIPDDKKWKNDRTTMSIFMEKLHHNNLHILNEIRIYMQIT